MRGKLRVFVCLLLSLLSMSVIAEDAYQTVVPANNIKTYAHRTLIAQGVLTYPGGVTNASGQLYITQVVTANASCGAEDAEGTRIAYPTLLVKLENTGSMNKHAPDSHPYGDNQCYISAYDINTSEATVLQSVGGSNKQFLLKIPFSVQQAGDWHSGLGHLGAHHYCGESKWDLSGFEIAYSIYCVVNNPQS